MGRNLTNLAVSESFQYLLQISGSEVQDGLGAKLTGSLDITASLADNATSASFAISSSQAVNAVNADSATSASYALTASFAENVTPTNTGSLLITASITDATTTYTKGDGSTFDLTVNNVVNATSASFATNATSASFATSASQAENAVSSSFATTASFALNADPAFPYTGSADILGSLNVNITESRVGTITSGSFTGSFVTNIVPTASITSQQVEKIVTLDQATYLSLSGSSQVYNDTLYVISDSTGSVIGSTTLTGSFVVTGSTTLTGSLKGNISALSIASNTASMDLSIANFYTLTLVDGSNTFINPSNISAGQTVNLRLTNGGVGTGTVSFAPAFKFPSGSLFTGSADPNAVDVVSFVSFDGTNLLANFIEQLV